MFEHERINAVYNRGNKRIVIISDYVITNSVLCYNI